MVTKLDLGVKGNLNLGLVLWIKMKYKGYGP